jgi:tetratricopeptide (TPR) repeat protein
MRVWTLVGVAGLTIGCHRGGGTFEDYIKRGDDFFAQKKIAEAAIEYQRAVNIKGGSGLALEKLGVAFMANGDYRRAQHELVRAADLLPTDLDAQLKAGSVLLVVGQFEDAKTRAQKAIDLDPKSVAAQILKGNALAALKDMDGAIAQVESAIRTDPSKSVGYSSLATLQFAKGDTKQAEALFQQAIKMDPSSVDARLAMANLYWSTGRRPEAKAMIQDALKIQPRSLMANRVLAVYAMSSGQMKDAEAPLQVLAADLPNGEGKLALADYYVTAQRTDEAKAILEPLARQPMTSSAANLRLASIGLAGNDRKGANQLVDGILKKEPRNVDALIAKARLQTLDGRSGDAVVSGKLATDNAPESPQARFALAQALAADNRITDAKAAYKEALRLNPRFASASLELGRLAMVDREFKDAITYAEGAINAVPGFADAYLLLAQAEVASGQPRLAEKPLATLKSAFPNSANVQAEVGRLQLAEGDLAGARASLERAIAGDATQIVALTGLTALDLKQKNQAAVRQRLDAAIAKAPQNSQVLVLAGRTYVELGDNAAAERVLAQSIAADAGNLDAYDLLARLYVKERRLPEATAEFQLLADRRPNAAAPQTALAVLMQLQNRWDDAAAHYQKAIAIDPTAAVAANNLAQIYADRNGNLDIALQLAKSAKAALPKTPEIDDTIGWIYLKKNLPTLAVPSLKQCLSADPQNPLYQYHLAVAYSKTGDSAQARDLLQRALKTGAAFDGIDDARTLLKTLKG